MFFQIFSKSRTCLHNPEASGNDANSSRLRLILQIHCSYPQTLWITHVFFNNNIPNPPLCQINCFITFFSLLARVFHRPVENMGIFGLFFAVKSPFALISVEKSYVINIITAFIHKIKCYIFLTICFCRQKTWQKVYFTVWYIMSVLWIYMNFYIYLYIFCKSALFQPNKQKSTIGKKSQN